MTHDTSPVPLAGVRAWMAALVRPSLSDWLFAALLGWLFVAGYGWSGLLADGDTGWHIRAGEFILDRGRLPASDPFSFTRAGEPWFAWEWLSDVLFAVCHRLAGLKGVVLLAGTVIAGYLTLLARHMAWRGANALAALAFCLVGAGASGIHYLARPHIFTLLLLTVSLWLVDADRRQPSRAVWLLVPLAALWANLHGGFVALLVSLALLAAGTAIEAVWEERTWRAAWRGARRRLALLAGCAAATLANPYGIGLHRHLAEYLKSDWIRQAVDEFQSPKFRGESALQFEILLFAGLILAGTLLGRRQVADALLVVAFAHAALVSVRHIPVFVVVACPILAAEASRLWAHWAGSRPKRSVARILDAVAADFASGLRRSSLWPTGLVLALALAGSPLRWPLDFPAVKFPVELVGRQQGKLAGARVFTSDQWGDYLLYRFYPRERVFIDGRSDFYGPGLGKLYLRVAYGHPEWRGTLSRYGVGLVLAPVEWPLAGALRQDPGWRLVEEDTLAALFERVAPAPCRPAVRGRLQLKKTPFPAEIPGGDRGQLPRTAWSQPSRRAKDKRWTADC